MKKVLIITVAMLLILMLGLLFVGCSVGPAQRTAENGYMNEAVRNNDVTFTVSRVESAQEFTVGNTTRTADGYFIKVTVTIHNDRSGHITVVPGSFGLFHGNSRIASHLHASATLGFPSRSSRIEAGESLEITVAFDAPTPHTAETYELSARFDLLGQWSSGSGPQSRIVLTNRP